MDHAVALVQSYLQLNGYFTSAESPIITGAGRRSFRSVTDIDVLAFRFPNERPLGKVSRRSPRSLDLSEIDPGLGVEPQAIDMIIAEVKEGRVGINSSARNPEVLKTVLGRLGQTGQECESAVDELLRTGEARAAGNISVRLILFGAFPPGAPMPPCRIISLGHVVAFLESYVRKHWHLLRHLQFKDPALGFVLALEKARRGAAGRRGEQGVEVVTTQRRKRGEPKR